VSTLQFGKPCCHWVFVSWIPLAESGTQVLESVGGCCRKAYLPIIFEVHEKTASRGNEVGDPTKTDNLQQEGVELGKLIIAKTLCGSNIESLQVTVGPTKVFDDLPANTHKLRTPDIPSLKPEQPPAEPRFASEGGNRTRKDKNPALFLGGRNEESPFV
jgi:hypothetical protein